MKKSIVAYALISSLLIAPSATLANEDLTKLHEVVYAVTLNDIDVSDGTILLQDSSNQLYAKTEDLDAWRLIFTKSDNIQYEGNQYIALASFPSLTQEIDNNANRLTLMVANNKLTPTKLNMHAGSEIVTVPIQKPTIPGMFINYDLHAEGGVNPAFNGLFEGGTALGSGIFDTSVLANFIGGTSHVVPIGTSWQHDNVNSHNTIIVGDTVTLSNSFDNQVNMTGVRFARNFGTEPQVLTTPIVSVNGSAAVPSVLNMYINNALAYTQSIPAGPYQVTSLPVIDGYGNVHLVMRDVQGNEQVINTSFYSSDMLLQKGLSSFEYDGGFVRTTATNGMPQYGDFVTRAYDRCGFSDKFTGEANVEYSARDAALGVAGNVQIGQAGIVKGGVSASTSALHTGTQATAGYNYESSRGDIGFNVRVANAAFVQAGRINNTGFQRDIQANVGVRIAHGSLGLAHGSEQNGLLGNTRVTTLSYSQPLGLNSFYITANRMSGMLTQSNIFASLRIPIGTKTHVTPSNISSNGINAPGLAVDHFSENLSYQAAMVGGPSGSIQGSLYNRQSTNDVDTTFESSNGQRHYSVDLSGAVSRVDGHTFFSEPIRNGYGIAEVPGYSGIGVFESGQMIGKTNHDGFILLPTLMPYMNNDISLENNDVPLSANIETVKQSVNPMYRLPAIVKFNVEKARGVTVHLKDTKGKWLPSGTLISDTSKHIWPVANDGLAYLDDISSGVLSLTAQMDDVKCKFDISVPVATDEIPDVGEIVCR